MLSQHLTSKANNYLVSDDLQLTIEWSPSCLMLVSNNVDTTYKINLNVETGSKLLAVCTCANMIISTIQQSESSNYMIEVRLLDNLTSKIVSDPKRMTLTQPIQFAAQIARESIVLFTSDFDILNFSWSPLRSESQIDHYPQVNAISHHQYGRMTRAIFSQEVQVKGKLIRMRSETLNEGKVAFYLQSTNNIIYRLIFDSETISVAGAVNVRIEDDCALNDFEVSDGKVHAVIQRRNKNALLYAQQRPYGELLDEEIVISYAQGSEFSARIRLVEIYDQRNRLIKKQPFISYQIQKDDNLLSELKVVLVEENCQVGFVLDERQVVMAPGESSVSVNKGEHAIQPYFGAIIRLRKEHRMYASIYEKAKIGNDQRVSLHSVELVRAQQSQQSHNSSATSEEQINILFQKLAENKHRIYDKNYRLIKPNQELEQFIALQLDSIPDYVLAAQNTHEVESLSFLYLLIKNKRHTLLTDIINIRALVKKNNEVFEFLILNVEGLESELAYLLFQSPVLEEMEKANFASKSEFGDFYQMINSISEIFHSILERKQKDNFEHLRERGQNHKSLQHLQAIEKAQSTMERIISYISVIKIKGWMVQSTFQSQNLSIALFDKNSAYIQVARQILNTPNKIVLQTIDKRNDLYGEKLGLFSMEVLSRFGITDFDPISVMKLHSSEQNVGVNPQSFCIFLYLQLIAKRLVGNNEFIAVINSFNQLLESIQNDRGLSKVMNATNTQLFQGLSQIDYLSETNRLETFRLLMDAQEDVAQLDPDLIVLIICTFAALQFKEETFLLIRSFNKSVNWLSRKNTNILINLYLKFENVNQAVQFTLAVESSASNNVSSPNDPVSVLIEKIVDLGLQRVLFRQQLSYQQEELLIKGFEHFIHRNDWRFVLIFIKYLVFKKRVVKAIQVFDSSQIQIREQFSSNEFEIVVGLFQALLKQFSPIQAAELLQLYPILRVNSDQSQLIVDSSLQNSKQDPSVIHLEAAQQMKFSVKKQVLKNVEDDEFVILLDLHNKNVKSEIGDQDMMVESPYVMTPQSKGRSGDLHSQQGNQTKSKRKWTTAKKNQSPS